MQPGSVVIVWTDNESGILPFLPRNLHPPAGLYGCRPYQIAANGKKQNLMKKVKCGAVSQIRVVTG